MAGYWIPIDDKERVYSSTLKDAYRDAAAIMLGIYRRTNGNIHKVVSAYHPSTGFPIYNSRTGKSANHWVRFEDERHIAKGYEEVSYGKAYGVTSKSKDWPKSWLKY